MAAARKLWSLAEEQVMRERFPHMPTQALADALGRDYKGVAGKAHDMGLRKSPAYLASVEACRLNGKTVIGHRFKAGNVPWNAGLAGSTGHHPNTAKNHFRKGAISGRAAKLVQPLGTLRITVDGTLERKTNDRPGPSNLRWTAVHRTVWESVNGPIPAGHLVVFKPGRKTSDEALITLDALELITRAENMRRNSLHRRYPKAVALVAQLRGALQRKINQATRNAARASQTTQEPQP